MEIRLLPLRRWLWAGVWAVLLHAGGAWLIDFLAWKWGLVYQVMAGQLLLLAGGAWLLIVLGVVLAKLRREGYLDPVRIIVWVLAVSLVSAPIKAATEMTLDKMIPEAFAQYPEKRATELRLYLRKQQIEPKRIEEVVQFQTRLYEEYRKKSKDFFWLVAQKLKVLGVLGVLYGLILGLLLRGGGSAE